MRRSWRPCLIGLALVFGVLARPLPPILPPGAIQPLAPGQRSAPRLPRLHWPGCPRQVERVEYASNGFITVAHAVLLLDSPNGEMEPLLRQVTRGAFATLPHLYELDVSVYRAQGYLGFGGPPPLLTASILREQLSDFYAQGLQYPRLWRSDTPWGTRPWEPLPERNVVFHGTSDELERQRQQQHQHQPQKSGLLFHLRPDRQEMALTFDDSPHPLYEPLLLDSLKRSGVQATFFCIGRNAQAYPYFVEDMVKAGHEVANHTYHHVRLPGLAPAQVESELQQTNQVLQALSQGPVSWFRPPGGEYSSETLALAERAGLTTVFWTDDPGDFDHPGEAVIEERLGQHLRPGGIILLHDNVLETIHLLPHFIAAAEKQGYRLTSLGQALRP